METSRSLSEGFLAPAQRQPALIPVPEVADRLNIGLSLAWALVQKGQIKSVRLGTRRLVPVAELDRILGEGLMAAAPTTPPLPDVGIEVPMARARMIDPQDLPDGVVWSTGKRENEQAYADLANAYKQRRGLAIDMGPQDRINTWRSRYLNAAKKQGIRVSFATRGSHEYLDVHGERCAEAGTLYIFPEGVE